MKAISYLPTTEARSERGCVSTLLVQPVSLSGKRDTAVVGAQDPLSPLTLEP